MTRDFREAVEKCTPDNTDTKCIDHQLKDVFVRLLKQTAHTDEITRKLGIDKVYEQQDAAECFEKILALTSSEASQIFHGELTRTITCSRCHTEKSTDGRFLHLPLELVDSNSEYYRVVHGIQEYFQTSYFSGDNQMYCEHCDTKSDATIECVMKDHPDVLVLLLKRFYFDYYYMSKVKNNRAVVIPHSLHFQQNQTYEVYAYVEHFGDLRGGHYTATIKSQDDERWYNFNDGSVTLLDNQPFQTSRTEKSLSVNLLFYMKKKTAYSREVISDGFSPPANRGDVTDVRLFSVGTQLGKSKEDQYCERGKQKPVWNRPQKGFIQNRIDPEHNHKKEARNRPLKRDYPRDCVEGPRDNERTDCKEKRKLWKGTAKHLQDEGLDTVDDDEGGQQEQYYVGEKKKREGERKEKDKKEGRTGEGKRHTVKHGLLLKPGGLRRMYKRVQQHKEERRNVKRDKDRRRGGDEPAQEKVEKRVKENRNKGDAQYSQMRQSDRRRQAENQGDSSAGYEEGVRKDSSEVMNRWKKTVEKTPQNTSRNRETIKRQSDPKPDGSSTLTKGLSSMKVNESPSPESQQRRAGNTQEENETSAAPQSIGEHAKKPKNKKRTPGCFFFFQKKDQNPDSE
ncbi:uncharacterized protein [Paralichthys olivaceus]